MSQFTHQTYAPHFDSYGYGYPYDFNSPHDLDSPHIPYPNTLVIAQEDEKPDIGILDDSYLNDPCWNITFDNNGLPFEEFDTKELNAQLSVAPNQCFVGDIPAPYYESNYTTLQHVFALDPEIFKRAIDSKDHSATFHSDSSPELHPISVPSSPTASEISVTASDSSTSSNAKKTFCIPCNHDILLKNIQQHKRTRRHIKNARNSPEIAEIVKVREFRCVDPDCHLTFSRAHDMKRHAKKNHPDTQIPFRTVKFHPYRKRCDACRKQVMGPNGCQNCGYDVSSI